MTFDLPDIRRVYDLRGKRVLLRTDFNVPIDNETVVNDFRIHKALDTILFLKERGAKIILLSHIGRRESETLRPVFEYLKSKMSVGQLDLLFLDAVINERHRGVVRGMRDGDIVLFENIRSERGEIRNDPLFVEYLVSLGDIYVNDAFSASHRAHASIVGLPGRMPHFAGVLLQKEVAELSVAFEPPAPAVLILGGAKFETKLPLIRKFAGLYDHLIIGGALAHDFLKAGGYEVGKSLTSDGSIPVADLVGNPRIMLPIDCIVDTHGKTAQKKLGEVAPEDVIMDVGPETIVAAKKILSDAQFVLWNGPMGHYEEGFTEQTVSLAEAITASNAQTIVGGGDTIAALAKSGLEKNFSFVSTGGGAMLQFLLEESLPGIEALRKANT